MHLTQMKAQRTLWTKYILRDETKYQSPFGQNTCFLFRDEEGLGLKDIAAEATGEMRNQVRSNKVVYCI